MWWRLAAWGTDMGVLAYTRYALSPGQSYANRAPGVFLYFNCDTEAERPEGIYAQDGDGAYTYDTFKRWQRIAGAWVLRTTDNLASTLLDVSTGAVYPVDGLEEGKMLRLKNGKITAAGAP